MNEQITATTLTLIDEQGHPRGEISFDQGMWLAYEKGVDLVEVGPTATPPVAKLMDFGKYKYELEKSARKSQGKSKGSEVKEVRISFKIGAHDLEVKAKRAKEFLSQGDRVRAFIKLRGREMKFQDRGRMMLEEFRQQIGGDVEQPISKLGNQFSMIIKKAK